MPYIPTYELKKNKNQNINPSQDSFDPEDPTYQLLLNAEYNTFIELCQSDEHNALVMMTTPLLGRLTCIDPLLDIVCRHPGLTKSILLGLDQKLPMEINKILIELRYKYFNNIVVNLESVSEPHIMLMSYLKHRDPVFYSERIQRFYQIPADKQQAYLAYRCFKNPAEHSYEVKKLYLDWILFCLECPFDFDYERKGTFHTTRFAFMRDSLDVPGLYDRPSIESFGALCREDITRIVMIAQSDPQLKKIILGTKLEEIILGNELAKSLTPDMIAFIMAGSDKSQLNTPNLLELYTMLAAFKIDEELDNKRVELIYNYGYLPHMVQKAHVRLHQLKVEDPLCNENSHTRPNI